MWSCLRVLVDPDKYNDRSVLLSTTHLSLQDCVAGLSRLGVGFGSVLGELIQEGGGDNYDESEGEDEMAAPEDFADINEVGLPGVSTIAHVCTSLREYFQWCLKYCRWLNSPGKYSWIVLYNLNTNIYLQLHYALLLFFLL